MTSQNIPPDDDAKLCRQAEEIARKKVALAPKNREALSLEQTRQMLHELRVQQIELELQNKELRTAQAELDAARARYFDLFDLAPVGYCTISEEGLILEANLTAATLLGVVRGALVKQPISRFILKEDRNAYFLHSKQLLKTGGPQAYEVRMVKQNGTAFWAHLEATASQDANSAPVIRVVLSDITERKEIEAGLEKSRKELVVIKKSAGEVHEFAESVINTVREPLISLDQDLRVVTVSRSFYEFFKVKPEETVGQLIYDLGNKQWDIPKLRELLETILPQQTSFDDYEVEHEFATIGRRIMLLNARQIERGRGKERIILLAIEDITEHKRLEELLAESEMRYRRIFETASDGIVLLEKREGHIVHANPAAVKMLGYSEEEYIGKMLQDIGVPIDMNDFPAIMESLNQSGILNYDDIPVKTKSGQELYTDIYMVDGAKLAQCNIRDITERKQADKTLKEEKWFIENALNTLQDIFFVFDLEGRFLRWNKTMNAVTGYIDSEIALMTITDFFRKDDMEQISDTIRKAFKEGSVNIETVGVTKDGRQIPYELSASLLSDAHGNPIGISGTGRDITERKKAEEALRKSEKRLAGIIDFLPDATFAVDRDSKVIAWNRAMEEMTGIAADKMIGTTGYEYALPFYGVRRPLLIDLVSAVDEEIEKKYLSVKRTGNTLLGETNVVIKGQQRTVLGTAAPLYDDMGNAAGAIESIRDVTERKRNEEEIARLAMIIDQAAEGIILTDTNWVIQYANPAFEHIAGYDKNEIIGQRANVLTSGVHGKEFFSNICETLSRGEIWSGRMTNRKKDGSLYEVDATGSPFRDESGKIISHVVIQHDITNEIRLERQLHQAQKMEAIGTLAGGIAHDFNNILTAIMGYTEILSYRVPSSSPLLPHLEKIHQASHRAADLVRQILTFSRQSEHELRPVQINCIVEEVLKLIRSSLPTTIEIRQEIAIAGQECVILADETQIHQVVMNLCTNAAYAMQAHGGVLGISLSSFEPDASFVIRHSGLHTGRYVSLKVSDTGHGMDAATMEQIFDPYFTTKPKGEGTGLGLAVVHGIVKNHGGVITVDSEPGKGTAFTIFLPGIETAVAQKAPAAAERLVGGNERILFVDDEEMLVDLGLELLESLGYSVTATTSSYEAFETFRSQSAAFDLVITDMTMPGFTGLELARKIVAIRPDIPIILATGISGINLLEQAREIGIRDVVMKPYDLEKMAKTIRRNIEGS